MPRTLPLLAAALLLAACSRGPEVTVVAPRHGPMEESFSEPARTRLAHLYRIVMPLDGRIGRIALEPGDPVEAGQELAPFDHLPFAEEARAAHAAVAELETQIRLNEYDEIERSLHVELTATVDAARDALKATAKQVEAGEVRAGRTGREQERVEALAAKGNASEQQRDDAAVAAETALIELREKELMQAAFNTLFTAIKLGPEYVEEWLTRKRIEREVITHQLTQARARLARADHDLELARLVSPIDGTVLERYERGDGPFPTGHPLLLLGRPEELEVIADLLTSDAQRLRPGGEVTLENGGGALPHLTGHVARIEPAGFTKLSSLGVEQQRVNVIVALDQRPADLGVGYRLHARFTTGRKPDALTLPRFSLLQEADGATYVFKVAEGRLVRQPVTTGLSNDRQIEILTGLTPDDRVVASPDTEMRAGERVTAVE